MSANSTQGPATLSLPPGFVPLPLVREELKWLLLETTYSAFLVPIAVVLFFFSTPQLRRQPVFILNVCAIGLGIAQGITGIYNSVNALLLNLSVTPRVAITLVYLFILVPFCVQAILILRVIAVYPPKTLSPTRRLVIYGPIVPLIQTIDTAGGLRSNSVFTVSQIDWDLPGTKAEWFLQLFDDMYASMLFILRIRKGTGVLGRQKAVEKLRTTSLSQGTYLHRLKTLFWIAVSSFVFPVIFNIAQLILSFHDSDFLDGSCVLYTNNYIEIIGVLLVTIWAAGAHRSEGESANGRLGRTGESMRTAHVALQRVGSSDPEQLAKVVPSPSALQFPDYVYMQT